MNFDEQVSILERRLKDLITDWERFFAGDRRVPPQKERDQLDQNLRRLNERARRTSEQFRLDQVQHRFMTYSMNWERMLREREEGRGRSVHMVRAARSVPPPSSDAAAFAGTANDSPSRSVDEGGEVGSLYDRYIAAKRSTGQSARVDRQAFAAQIREQQDKLEARLGYRVQFDVVVDGEKVKLAARKVAGSK